MLQQTCGSDHLPIIIKLGVRYNTTGSSGIPRWKLGKADWDKFKTLCSTKLKLNKDAESINEIASDFTKILQNICEETIPKTKPKCSKIKPPWRNQDCAIAIKKREKARKKYLRTRTQQDKQHYNMLKTESKTTLKKAQKDCWEDFISKLNHKTSSKEVWDMIRKFRGKRSEPITCLKTNDQIITNDRDKAQLLAQHYADTSKSENYDPKFQNIKKIQDNIYKEAKPHMEEDNEHNLNRLFTQFELNRALQGKKNTAPGADTISYEMLKQLPPSSKAELLNLINLSWVVGELPSDWKVATIIPIKKPLKDKTNPSSYRPISLTSAFCKIMETMIAFRLNSYIERNNLISNNQSGFRKHRSTIDQLVRLSSEINMAFMENKAVGAIFLDLEKAFDLMWSTGTLVKLNKIGINGHMLNWIQHFLKGRKIQVRLGENISDIFDLENGSPQGGVLRPTLFNVIMNTLPEALNDLEGISLSQFADDGAIWTKHSSAELAVKKLQKALDVIEAWGTYWGFKISPDKTKAIIFSRKIKDAKTDSFRLTLNGKTLDFVDKVTFLGLTMDRKLTWKHHIDQLIVKCNKDLNLMRMISRTTFGADKKCLVNLYKALILSKLDYGAQAFNSAHKSQLGRLNIIQNEALRIATRARRTTPIPALEVECGVLPLSLRREELILKYWARSSPLGDNLPVNQLITDFGCLTTKRAKNFNPYSVEIRQLLKEHNINHNIAPPYYLEKWDLQITHPH